MPSRSDPKVLRAVAKQLGRDVAYVEHMLQEPKSYWIQHVKEHPETRDSWMLDSQMWATYDMKAKEMAEKDAQKKEKAKERYEAKKAEKAESAKPAEVVAEKSDREKIAEIAEKLKKKRAAEAAAVVEDVTGMFEKGKEAAGGGSAEPVKKSIKERVLEKKINEYMKTISGAELSDFMKLDTMEKNRAINTKNIAAKAAKRIEDRKEEEQKAVMVEQPRVTKVIKKSFSLKNSSPDASSVRDISDAVSKRTKEHVAGLPIYGMKKAEVATEE